MNREVTNKFLDFSDHSDKPAVSGALHCLVVPPGSRHHFREGNSWCILEGWGADTCQIRHGHDQEVIINHRQSVQGRDGRTVKDKFFEAIEDLIVRIDTPLGPFEVPEWFYLDYAYGD